jgi:hypothetical protein
LPGSGEGFFAVDGAGIGTALIAINPEGDFSKSAEGTCKYRGGSAANFCAQPFAQK